MSRLRIPGRAPAALGALLFVIAAAACEEDGKTAPEKCLQPPLAIYDIQSAGEHGTDNPCVTPIGHSVSSVGTEPTTGGTSAGSAGKGGTAGTAGKGGGGSGGGSAMNAAGAGGA